MNRRQFLKGALGVAGVATLAGCSRLPLRQQSPAQQAAKLARIGHLAYTVTRALSSVRDGLRNLGYIENEQFRIESRYSDRPDELDRYAADLVGLGVDLILVTDTPSIRAAQKATGTIPIVMLTSADPVASGFIQSLARPGRNITGLSQNRASLSAKRLELLLDTLKHSVASVSRVTVLLDPADEGTESQWRASQAAAQKLGVTLDRLEVRRREDVAPSFASVARERADALLVFSGLAVSRSFPFLFEDAVELRVPAMFDNRIWVDAGGLMSYGPDLNHQSIRAATFVDKILKGANPADLPVEQPSEIEMVVNSRAARALGLSVPRSILSQATDVLR